MKRIIAPLALLPLAACATATPPPFDDEGNPRVRPEAAECNARPAQTLIGDRASSDIAAQVRDVTGARSLRWAPEGSALTMDFRPDRVNIAYDTNLVIERIWCG